MVLKKLKVLWEASVILAPLKNMIKIFFKKNMTGRCQ